MNKVIYNIPSDEIAALVQGIVQEGLTFECRYMDETNKYQIVLTGGY